MSFTLRAIVVLFLICTVYAGGNPRGLADNVTSVCSPSCDWTQSEIWDANYGGGVPQNGDQISLLVKGTYTITISTAVVLGDLNVGIDDAEHNSGLQTVHIASTGSLTLTGKYTGLVSSVLTVDQNATLYVSGQSTAQGPITLGGYANFAGSEPSLSVDTKDAQVPIGIVYGQLTLNEGVLQAANGVQISATSTLTGSGDINGTLYLNGNIYPGGDKTIGAINVAGDFKCDSTTDVYLDVASPSSFDHIGIGGTSFESGDMLVTVINDYTPLSHQLFIVFNHSAGLRNGFDTTKSTSVLAIFNNKWTEFPDQSYTGILYDDASSVLISVFTISACLLFTLL